MVHNNHRRVGHSDAGKKQGARGGRFTLRRHGMVAACLVSMTALSLTVMPADAAVSGGRSIEVFTGSNLVSLTSYPANTDVRVEVLRQGFVIGSAVKQTDANGQIEMNHSGVTDCFDGPSSPDIGMGDTIRTTILSSGARDTSVVRGVRVDNIQYGATSITVSGHVTLAGAAKVVPNTDVLELRINLPQGSTWASNNRRDNRVDIGANVQPNGNWTRVINATAQDVNEAQAGSDTFLEWSSGAAAEAAFPPELTVWDAAGAEPLDCPTLQQEPTAPKLANAMDSAKVGDHVTSRSANLSFSGLAGTAGANASATLFVDGAAGPTVQANAQGVYSFANVDLAANRAHSLKVRATSEDGSLTLTSVARRVAVDTVAPTLVQRRFGPSPLHLAGPEQLRAVYRVNETSKVAAKVQHRFPTRTVNTLAVRNLRAAGLVEYGWNGKNEAGRNVQPGRYQLMLTSTDVAGNQTSARALFRVVR